MKITKVIIKKKLANAQIKAIADIVIEDCLVIHGIKIFEKDGEYMIGMPDKKFKDRWFDVVHPITKELREQFTKVIIDEYKKTEAVNTEENEVDNE